MSTWKDGEVAFPAGRRRLGSRFALIAGVAFGLLVACLVGVYALLEPRALHPPQSASSTVTFEAPASDFPSSAAKSRASATTPRAGHTRGATSAGTTAPSTRSSASSAAAGGHAGSGAAATGTASATAGANHLVAEVRDPEEARSYPAPASVHHSPAKTPARAGELKVAAGAASDAEIRSELAKMKALEDAANQPSKMPTVPGGNSIVGIHGAIPIPTDVPEVVQRVIAGANAIADFPYVYGGGHASFVDTAYDCSGSVSYALAAGGLLSAPETSGQLESWGAPGPGRWITVYANAGHTYMYVNTGAGWMLYDTAGRSGVFASRWQPYPVDNSGYVVRHYPGL